MAQVCKTCGLTPYRGSNPLPSTPFPSTPQAAFIQNHVHHPPQAHAAQSHGLAGLDVFGLFEAPLGKNALDVSQGVPASKNHIRQSCGRLRHALCHPSHLHILAGILGNGFLLILEFFIEVFRGDLNGSLLENLRFSRSEAAQSQNAGQRHSDKKHRDFKFIHAQDMIPL